MFCKRCGEPITEDMKFCAKCGQAVDKAAVIPEKEPAAGTNKKLWIVLLCVVAAVVLVAAGAAGAILLLPPQTEPAPDGEESAPTTVTTAAQTTVTEATTTTAAPTTVATTTAPTEPPVQSISARYRIISKGGVDFHQLPSADSPVMGGMAQGYIVSSDRQSGSWVYVYSDNMDGLGWAHLNDLRNLNDEPGVTGYTGLSGSTLVVRTNDGNGVNMRTGPSTDYPIIVSLKERSQVTLCDRQGDWYYVYSYGLYGWVKGQYLW